MTNFDIKGRTKCHIRKIIYDFYMTSVLYVCHKPFWTQMPGGFICVLFAKRFVGISGKVCISSLWKCISYKNPMVHYFTVAS